MAAISKYSVCERQLGMLPGRLSHCAAPRV